MALIELSYFSKALKTGTSVSVILPEVPRKSPSVGIPEGGPYKTLYLLHGLTGDHHEWIRQTSIERYASEYGIAVVMPEVGRTWYTNSVRELSYFSFITDELPEVCRGYFKGMSSRREDNAIAGLSMGGYGALKAALCCPEKYGFCASLSGSVDITRRRATPIIVNEWKAIFDFDLNSPLELEGTDHDIYKLARSNKEKGIQFPKLYIWCGTEDGLLTANRDYHSLLLSLGVEHCYQESEGDHSWKWWDLHIQDALAYLYSAE